MSESKSRLLVSFSGGRTSAFMMKKLRDGYSDAFEMIFVFANTSQEDEETLIFVDRCAKEWNIPVVWIEAVVHHDEAKGCTHRIVDFKSACRDGSVFEEVIKKYGIPNKAYPHCTRELKLNPIRSYCGSLGWTEYKSAVGIRMDEPRRYLKSYVDSNIVHPLVNWFPTTKADIFDWWRGQPFDLNLQEIWGNCVWCWKKSVRKHVNLIQETPEVFDFPRRMEAQYGLAGHNVDGTKRVFFREHRSTVHLFELAKLLNPYQPVADPEENEGCSESCEPFVLEEVRP